MSDLTDYPEHLARLEAIAAEALERSARAGQPWRGIALHAGSHRMYHADDHEVPFRSLPHFARYTPLPGPGHLLLVQPGQPTRLLQFAPRDFWVEGPEPLAHPSLELLRVTVCATSDELRAQAGDLSGWAWLGEDAALGRSLGVDPAGVEPELLLAALDWHRGVKTPYEAACLRAAAARAGLGHAAVRAGLARGWSERRLHAAYLEATGHLEHETPYQNIVAWDEAGAVLHYQRKRAAAPAPGHTFLIDAGARALGYASDVTRTYVRPDAPEAFRRLVAGVHRLQDELVEAVRPGLPYGELHDRSWQLVARLLVEEGLITVSPEEACERRLVRAFYPHGVGHHLGLQVHDVGGQQAGPEGGRVPPPERHPHLRTTRPLEAGHVVTVEPGVYFIPLLLEPLRAAGERGLAWDRIDPLLSCGGIRVEDDVLVTETGHENLSRPHVPVEYAL